VQQDLAILQMVKLEIFVSLNICKIIGMENYINSGGQCTILFPEVWRNIKDYNLYIIEKNMNKLKFIHLIFVTLTLLTASNAVSQTQFTVETIPPQEALGYVNFQHVHMPLIAKAWEHYLTSRTRMSLSEYGDVIDSLYRDFDASFEAYEACLRQDRAGRKQASNIVLEDLQNLISKDDIIKNKEVIKKTLGVFYLIATIRSCHEGEKTAMTKESYLTHALAKLLRDQRNFIKTQDDATQHSLQEYTEKIGELLQTLAYPVLQTTVAANGFNAFRFEQTLEACQKQNPTIFDLLRNMPLLQRPFDVIMIIDELDSWSLSTP